jgi:hypothetical protein
VHFESSEYLYDDKYSATLEKIFFIVHKRYIKNLSPTTRFFSLRQKNNHPETYFPTPTIAFKEHGTRLSQTV